MQITVILTCFNRKEKTVSCIKSLKKNSSEYNLKFIVVDDNSNDGTREAVAQLGKDISIIKGSGELFWAGGMRVGIENFLSNDTQSDYVLLVNDDVAFKENMLQALIEKSKKNNNAVIVGATCDSYGNFTYGGMILENPKKKGIYRHVGIEDGKTACDLFNCNCVLLTADIVKSTGNFDPIYVHGMADLDYGLKLSRSGKLILSSDDYVGICETNSIKGTWQDTTLSRIERLKKKESPKGAPLKPWFHYIHKNFGIFCAIQYSISSYVKILLGK